MPNGMPRPRSSPSASALVSNLALTLALTPSLSLSLTLALALTGKTGFGAAINHAPQDKEGNERYVVFCGPHIAIDK